MPAERTSSTVLVVDDDDLDRFLVKLMLDSAGYRVVEASSAEAALDMIRDAQRPDAMIVDYVMDGMDGVELCQRVRAQEALRDLPILMRTGVDNRHGLARARAAGVNQLLPKSSDPAPLLALLAQALGR